MHVFLMKVMDEKSQIILISVNEQKRYRKSLDVPMSGNF